MPALNQPVSLCSLASDALCGYIYQRVTEGPAMCEDSDEYRYIQDTEDLILKVFDDCDTASHVLDETLQCAMSLKRVQTIMDVHDIVPERLHGTLTSLPADFSNKAMNDMLVSLSKIVVYDEKQIQRLLNSNWSFGARLNIALGAIMKSMMSNKISTLNFSPISNAFCQVLARYFLSSGEDAANLDFVDKKKAGIFLLPIFSGREILVNVTSLSLQNLASPKLVQGICLCCPNLWHLDISGDLFDMGRYCTMQRIASDPTKKKDLERYCAEFLLSLGGIYGGLDIKKKTFNVAFQSLSYLRTLLLPDLEWNVAEEFTLLNHVCHMLKYCKDLEEVSGVHNFMQIFQNFSMDRMPLILKLKKFRAKTIHGRACIFPKDTLKVVGLPCVTDVEIEMHWFLNTWVFEDLPNMKHLKVTSARKESAYTCTKMLPHLKNLISLDIEFLQEMSMNDICNIASTCKLLESFKLTCLALRMEVSGTEVTRKKDQGPSDKVPCDSFPQSLQEYIQSWLKLPPALYEENDDQVPAFSRLHTFMIRGVSQAEEAALYKCLKGSSNIRTFALEVVWEKSDDSSHVNHKGNNKASSINDGDNSNASDINDAENSNASDINDGENSNASDMKNKQNSNASEINDGENSKASDINNKDNNNASDINDGENSNASDINDGENSNAFDINDEFVLRVAPLLKRLRHFTVSGRDKSGSSLLLFKGLTCQTVQHIINFCDHIESIGGVSSWNLTTSQVQAFNASFKKQNYILRLS